MARAWARSSAQTLASASNPSGSSRLPRVSLPTQVFQINEPIFFGIPIVLNPILMVPYILSALKVTASAGTQYVNSLVGDAVAFSEESAWEEIGELTRFVVSERVHA